jgi:hypothetical protein
MRITDVAKPLQKVCEIVSFRESSELRRVVQANIEDAPYPRSQQSPEEPLGRRPREADREDLN